MLNFYELKIEVVERLEEEARLIIQFSVTVRQIGTL